MRRPNRPIGRLLVSWLPLLTTAALALLIAGCGTQQLDGIDPGGTGGLIGTGAGPSIGGSTGLGGDTGSCEGAPADAANGGKSTPPGFMSPTSPVLNGLVTAAEPPPPISGGTLLVLRDGKTAIAADADRDRVYVVDLGTRAVRASIALTPRDQPGRLVQDGAGLVHLVLRGSGTLATIDVAAAKVTQRRAVCSAPRGLAYDAATDRLHVACGGGELVTFTPSGTAPERTLNRGPDLRDVVVDGSRLMVTRFRSAEVMVVDDAGTMVEHIHPASFAHGNVQFGAKFKASVAWRATSSPDGGMVMVHQRGMEGTVGVQPGGYGGLTPCGSIVHSTVSRVRQGERPAAGPAFPGFVLPVDLAVSPDGKRVALVAAGNGHAQNDFSAQKLFVAGMDDVTQEWDQGCGNDGKHGPGAGCFGGPVDPAGSPTVPRNPDGSCPVMFEPCGQGCVAIGSKCDPGRVPEGTTPGTGGASATGGATGTGATTGNMSSGDAGTGTPPSGGVGGSSGVGGASGCGMHIPGSVEPVSVAFADNNTVVVQSREPAQLFIVTDNSLETVTLSSESRADTGHTVFHANSGGGIACASCHPEGHEDGRVWSFACDGARRTQDLGGGISGTEPFHWNGDLGTFPTLVDTVFVGRMSGPFLSREQQNATLQWINTIPARAPLRAATDPTVARGKALFERADIGCATCHSGSAFTNNMNADVKTSRQFQVPSLRGLSSRAPFMHDGCASSLTARFTDTACGGGDFHGKTSQLTPLQLSDLVGYLESL